MRIDRYYSSIKENEAKFSTDALALLENEDYVEFFKSCGVGFVRRYVTLPFKGIPFHFAVY
jgi:hypothetical protein